MLFLWGAQLSRTPCVGNASRIRVMCSRQATIQALSAQHWQLLKHPDMHRLKNDLASHYLRSISTRTLRSAGGTRIVFEAWHLYVLFSAARVILCISKRFTVTWRPIDTPPPVCITSSPFSHVTVGSGRPEMSQQDSTEQKKESEKWHLASNCFNEKKKRKLHSHARFGRQTESTW